MPIAEVATSARDAANTALCSAAVLSLILGLLPMVWGQIRPRWIVTALTSCVMFGLAGIVTAAMPRGWTIDAHVATAVIVVGMLVTATGAAGWLAIVAAQRRRARTRQAAETVRLETDPARVARDLAPDLLKQVERAISRMDTLRSLSDRIATQEDADALAMVSRRVPSVMALYRTAASASDRDERTALARTALTSVIEIGEMAEQARARIADGLRTELDAESRYISVRTGVAADELSPIGRDD